MTVTLHLSTEAAGRLGDKAAHCNKTLQAYLEELAENESSGLNAALVPISGLSDEDFERLLDDLAAGPALPHLPDNFSRTDVYTDQSSRPGRSA